MYIVCYSMDVEKTSNLPMEQKEIALSYARNGIRVFPCNAQKRPAIRGGEGFKQATDDQSVVSEWWDKHPDALIGAPNDQFIVLDFDDYDQTEPMRLMFENYASDVLDLVVTDGCLKVKTLSGGTHYFFAPNPDIKRRIKQLGDIDVLANGGYGILPDQKNYVCENSDTPWDHLGDSLPTFDVEVFDAISEEHKDFSDAYKSLKAPKDTTPNLKKDKNKVETKRSKQNTDPALLADVAKTVEKEGINTNLGSIDYDSDEIRIEMTDGVYSRSERDDIYKIDPSYDMTDEMPMRIGEQSLTNDRLMMMFHNQSVQRKMASFMNIPYGEVGETCSFHSVLPNHKDETKSMGSRWSEDGTHLIVKDFANFFGDKNQQTDYNLVRLFMVQNYKTNVPRMNGPEWTTWCLRLMYEAEVITVDHLIKPYNKSMDKLSKGQKEMAISFQLLDALKSSYQGYCGSTTFADKFSAAWSGCSPSSANSHKNTLEKSGFIRMDGKYDCSGGKRTDGFFKTKLLSVITKEKLKEPDEPETEQSNEDIRDMRLNEAVEIITTDQSEKKSKEMDARYPDLGTIASLVVDEKDQSKIKNFVEDIGLGGTHPMPENLMIPVLVAAEYEILDLDQSKTYFMDNFVLDVIEASEGGKILVAYGVSPPMTELIEELQKEHESLLEDGEDLGLVVSNDVGDVNLDLDKLTIQFNEYVGGRLSFSSVDLRYMDVDSIVSVLDGRMPVEEG